MTDPQSQGPPLSLQPLQQQARALFEDVVRLTSSRPGCHPVARDAAAWVATFGEPMRVAVAGEIKCGKSTLVNGLVGAEVALSVSDDAQDRAMEEAGNRAMATGQLETTYVLTELVHGSPPGLVVHHRDGTTRSAPLDALHELTVRRDPADATLKEIDRVVAVLHAPLLADFRLIDTPGFNSVYGHDAAASLNLLTSTECDRADAIVYTIGNEGLTGIGQEIAQRFVGGRGTTLTPMKAIGVMPRINEIWPSLVQERFRDPETDTDPFARARSEIDTLLTTGGGRGLFHTVVPVAGLMAEGAALAPDDDLVALSAFTAVDDAVLTRSLVMAMGPRRFAVHPGLPLDPAVRQRLLATFSPYGVWAGVRAARDRPSVPELRRILDERSGVAGLRDLVRNHFGARAGAVRVHDALQHLLRLNRNHRMRMPESHADRQVLVDVGERLDAFQRGHAIELRLIDVLGLYYRGEWRPRPAQTRDLLHLTGERGPALADRLGLPSDASPAELRTAAVALSARWAAASAGSGLAAGNAIATLQRACDEILHTLDGGTAAP
ncbi:dynamin family protein [Streptomyces phaeofaciens JCM 4814]|uniref:Isoniazid inductible gene protein IniC n=1 Tax=Streptomyces phaeofaciens TaxID=68254 RepID=A0A918H1M3_9ACTN|nr:GTPase [Streptomyces phaeofaciens]GGT32681.1 isoniazid inductible gene protein IniC [Streptomyces phaeofaciens]